MNKHISIQDTMLNATIKSISTMKIKVVNGKTIHPY